MRNFRNYYEILGVPRYASNEEIKRSYRKLARQFHPDLNPGNKAAEERFKDINESYDLLSDPEKRAQYDRFGQFWKQQGFQGGSSGTETRGWWGRTTGESDEVDFSQYTDFQDFLDQLLGRPFGRSNDGPTTPRGGRVSDPFRPGTTKTTYTARTTGRRDAEARLQVPLEKAYSGGRERIRLEDGRSLEVNMPTGMVTGQKIRLKGQGTGGGDLYLKIEVLPHAFFQLDGNDILCELPITPSEAILGGQIEAPTLDGWVKMTIPRGVHTGQRLRLSGKGYPITEDKRGDQLVIIRIDLPQNISAQERELYEQLRQIETHRPRTNLPI